VNAFSALSLAASSVAFLVAVTELHVTDQAARHFGWHARGNYLRGALVGGMLLAALAAIAFLVVSQDPSPATREAGGLIVLLVGFRFFFLLAAGRRIAHGADICRVLISLDDPNEPVAAEKRGAQVTLIQGYKVAATWLGASLFANPAVAALAIALGIVVAIALHARLLHPLSPSILFAGCAVSATSLGLHVISNNI